jgi:hypothetical protein
VTVANGPDADGIRVGMKTQTLELSDEAQAPHAGSHLATLAITL